MTYVPPTKCPFCAADSIFDHCFSCGETISTFDAKARYYSDGFFHGAMVICAVFLIAVLVRAIL